MKDNSYFERAWNDCRTEMFGNSFIIEKLAFENLIDAMIIKIHKKYNKGNFINKTPASEDALANLEWMKHFLEKITFKNCISHFQAKVIIEQDRRIVKLEVDKQKLIEELEQIKKRIE